MEDERTIRTDDGSSIVTDVTADVEADAPQDEDTEAQEIGNAVPPQDPAESDPGDAAEPEGGDPLEPVNAEPAPAAEVAAVHAVEETPEDEPADLATFVAEAEEAAAIEAETAPDAQDGEPVEERAEENADAGIPIDELDEVEPVEVEAAPPGEVEPGPPVEEPEPEPETAVPDPFRGPGDWYVVHTYAGYENKVKTNLSSRIHTMQMEDKIYDVHIPMEDVMEIKGGKKQVVQKKVFPGYLLVKMIYDNDSWYVVRNTPGVTGFVAAGTGTKPTPLSRREVEKILAVKKEEVKPAFRLGFEEDDVVRIISGPFADFNGTISEINVDQSKLKVLVNIFDRETPVELGFDQVAKV
jgi:transcription termination/antitermination protein NusG